MVEPVGDQEFLRSIFLMEAWDSVVVIEDGMARIASGAAEPSWDDIFVVAHRLKGAASLHGFTGVAALADTVEKALRPLPGAPPSARAAAA
ncbi:MAG TPA: Hpt domain-containing protein, partial [Methylomirabilota bacterium]|nr:Hpt domain-containing protein [Methylomirabilota bacterium]